MRVTKTRQTMIDSNNDSITEQRELSAVVAWRVARASGKASAVKRNQHRSLRSVIHSRSPYIEREAVFAHSTNLHIPLNHHSVLGLQVGGRLRADLTVGEAFANTGPGCWLLRRHEASLPAG